MNPGNTFARTALAIIFLVTLAVFFFGTILSEKKEISLQEKRQLAKFPQFTWKKSSLESWPKSLNEYLQDHLFHREDLVYLNGLLRVKLLRRSPTFLVLAGAKDWYFFMGDWALHDYLGQSGMNNPALTHSWEKLITLRQQRLEELGGNYLVAVAPNKECVYPEFLPERFTGKRGVTMLDALKKQMAGSPLADHFLDLGEPLQLAKATGQVYYKTDTHWNDRGAYFAYRAIIERVRHWYPEITPLPEESFDHRQGENSTGGDLVLTMGLSGAIPEKEESWFSRQPCSEQQNRKILSKALPAGKSLQANGCPAGAALRVLVISDSFGDGLQKYLSETFQHVAYSRELSFPDLQNYITEYLPDVVLDLRVGRYLPKVMTPGQKEKIND